MPVGRAIKSDIPSIEALKRFSNFMKQKCKRTINFHHTIEKNVCKAGIDRLFIDSNGDLYGCGWVPRETPPVCNINGKNIIEINNLLSLIPKNWQTSFCPINH